MDFSGTITRLAVLFLCLTSVFTPCTAAENYCVRVQTNTGSGDDGGMAVKVDSGSGLVQEASGNYWAKGSIVLQKCYSNFVSMEVLLLLLLTRTLTLTLEKYKHGHLHPS